MTEDGASIKVAEELLRNGDIARVLTYVIANFSVLEKAIMKLETAGMPLRKSLDVVKILEKKRLAD